MGGSESKGPEEEFFGEISLTEEDLVKNKHEEEEDGSSVSDCPQPSEGDAEQRMFLPRQKDKHTHTHEKICNLGLNCQSEKNVT